MLRTLSLRTGWGFPQRKPLIQYRSLFSVHFRPHTCTETKYLNIPVYRSRFDFTTCRSSFCSAVTTVTNTKNDGSNHLEELKTEAASGDAKAQFMLAILYFSGSEEVRPDPKRAFKYFYKSAVQGYPEAEYYVGHCYLYGEGTEVDQKQAVDFFLMAADKGNTVAQNTLGELYLHGTGVERDLEEAVKYFKRAARAGYEDAEYNLASCYMEGIGMSEPKPLKGVHLLQIAAEKGHLAAQYEIGHHYLYGSEHFQQNLDLATAYITKSANQEYPPAMSMMAELSLRGILKIPQERVIEYLRKAAFHKDPIACVNLGVRYTKGDGVEQSFSKAHKLLSDAIDLDVLDAHNAIGALYYMPDASNQYYDLKKAVFHFKYAAEKGHSSAQANLGVCYRRGQGVVMNFTKAFKYFKLAADQDHPVGLQQLAECYNSGLGVEQDNSKAHHYMALANAAKKTFTGS